MCSPLLHACTSFPQQGLNVKNATLYSSVEFEQQWVRSPEFRETILKSNKENINNTKQNAKELTSQVCNDHGNAVILLMAWFKEKSNRAHLMSRCKISRG